MARSRLPLTMPKILPAWQIAPKEAQKHPTAQNNNCFLKLAIVPEVEGEMSQYGQPNQSRSLPQFCLTEERHKMKGFICRWNSPRAPKEANKLKKKK